MNVAEDKLRPGRWRKSNQGLQERNRLPDDRPHNRSVNGAVIVVVRLRQTAVFDHHPEGIEGTVEGVLPTVGSTDQAASIHFAKASCRALTGRRT